MRRRLAAAILLAWGAAPARAAAFPVMRVGVVEFESAAASVDGATASDLFSTSLYRSFPGLSVTERSEIAAAISAEKLRPAKGGLDQRTAELLQETLGLDSLVLGDVLSLDKDPGGGGGTMMMSARLVSLSTGEILWADTRTVRVERPLLGGLWNRARGDSGAAVADRLLELAVFKLVQDLGKRLPEEALVPPGRRAARSAAAAAQDCAPPVFYRSLPRDDDWYYGVGRDPDTGAARAAAVADLAARAEGGPPTRMREREVADKVEGLPPGSGALAGWEQDDYQRCAGVSYVLVRIEKRRVREAVAASSRPEPAPAFTDKIPSARALEEIARANAVRSAMIYSNSAGPRGDCGARGCRSAPTPSEAAVIAAARRRLAAGTITAADVVRVSGLYAEHSEDDAERDFFDAVLYRRRPLPDALEGSYAVTRELVFPLAWDAALMRKDWQGFFKYCCDYLREYPDGSYAATAEKNRENAAKVLLLGDAAGDVAAE